LLGFATQRPSLQPQPFARRRLFSQLALGPAFCMSTSYVHIVLPTFNGEQHIAQQLDSLLAQTHTQWCAWLRDDGSTDNTLTIAQHYAQQHPHRFVLLQDNGGNLGVKGNVTRLLEHVVSHIQQSPSTQGVYIALADQDDFWLPHKLQAQLACIRELESAHPNSPCLVHSDLAVVDAQLNSIAPSMAAYNGLRVGASSLGAQLVSNTLTGCTGLFNVALARLALPVPPQAIMHDWWLSLVASAMGHRHYMATSLVLYRQHGFNTIGAKALLRTRTFVWQPGLAAFGTNLLGLSQALLRFVQRLHNQDHNAIFQANALQARAFGQQYSNTLAWRHKLLLLLARSLQFSWPPMQRVIFYLLRRL